MNEPSSQGLPKMETVDLDDLPAGATLIVREADVFSRAGPTSARAFLCADSEMRLVTMANGTRFVGAPTREELLSLLTLFEFRAEFQEGKFDVPPFEKDM